VIIRRNRKFSLASSWRRRYSGIISAAVGYVRQKGFLVVTVEIPAFIQKFTEFGMPTPGCFSGPCQEKPHLQIEYFLFTELVQPVSKPAPITVAGQKIQFQVAFIGFYHPLPIGGKKILQNKNPVFLVRRRFILRV
jgi:hypothetical protein